MKPQMNADARGQSLVTGESSATGGFPAVGDWRTRKGHWSLVTDCSLVTEKVRILHVLGSMNRGGIETWLMEILRHIDRDRYKMDFLVHTTQPAAYDEEIRGFGSRILPCLYPSRPWSYALNFQRIMREFGPYDIVHSHVHHFSGYVLWLAKYAGVPIRIAHTHTDTVSSEQREGFYRRMYFHLMKSLINRFATVGLASNYRALAALFGSDCDYDLRWRVVNYGFDLTPFQERIDPNLVRAELGIPADAFVIGHVGRFVEVKNHTFILDIAAEVIQREPKMYLLLVGDGLLRPDIEQKAVQLGLSDRVIFTGVRSDIPRLMRGAMDVFLFPSLYEGLGNVRLEAQAAGLPSVISDVVPEQGDVIRPLVKRVSLSLPACLWAETLLQHRDAASIISPSDAWVQMANSQFNVETALKQMKNIYLSQFQKLNEVVI
ncbi:glycosyltransferase family 1 protein [Scytonema sp. NUACC26]|uniref:glycosyltransferase family 1 protein n=1 Tax=Scytonema sp. NUACC26 TaxID=3140176 RepID=UPI0038B3F272